MTFGRYGNWALAAVGVLGVTYGVGRMLRGRRDMMSLSATAAVVPLAVRGFRSLLQEVGR